MVNIFFTHKVSEAKCPINHIHIHNETMFSPQFEFVNYLPPPFPIHNHSLTTAHLPYHRSEFFLDFLLVYNNTPNHHSQTPIHNRRNKQSVHTYTPHTTTAPPAIIDTLQTSSARFKRQR